MDLKIRVACSGGCGKSMELDPIDPMARGWSCAECGPAAARKAPIQLPEFECHGCGDVFDDRLPVRDDEQVRRLGLARAATFCSAKCLDDAGERYWFGG